MTLEEYMLDICEDLGIAMPEVVYTEDFPIKTMMAQAASDGSEIRLRKKKPDRDYFFAVAHEMRHCWQAKNDTERYFGDYKTEEEIVREAPGMPRQILIDRYNEQEAELDANAYAAITMDEIFGCVAQFRGLSQRVKRKIHERMAELLKEWEKE